jgi:hypothetical protein
MAFVLATGRLIGMELSRNRDSLTGSAVTDFGDSEAPRNTSSSLGGVGGTNLTFFFPRASSVFYESLTGRGLPRAGLAAGGLAALGFRCFLTRKSSG